MSYDYSRNGGTNAGSGMVPHRPACKCDECTIDGLRRKIAALQRERDEAVAKAERLGRAHGAVARSYAGAVALLREIGQRDRHWSEGGYDVRMYVGDYERIEAFLAKPEERE